MLKKCYMCNEDATTSEHVPAKFLFPEGQRKDLITVPSCVKHNNKTSGDDEFFRNILTICVEQNEYGENLFKTKTLNSIKRKPNNINMLGRAYRIYITNKHTRLIEPSLAFKIDLNRLDKVIEKIVKGIFYHEKQENFIGIVTDIFATILYNFDNFENIESKKKNIIETFDIVDVIKKGNNSDIFYYQIYYESDIIFICICFYGHLKIFVTMLSAFKL